MRISDWSSDVCSSDLGTAEIGDLAADRRLAVALRRHAPGLGFGLAALLALQPRLLLGIALEHGQRLGHVADLVLAPGIADLGRLPLGDPRHRPGHRSQRADHTQQEEYPAADQQETTTKEH